MHAWEVVKALSETSSRLEKESILEKAWDENCYDFFRGAQWAYDTLKTCGVKQVPQAKKAATDFFEFEEDSTYTIDNFFNILIPQLENRELTGNAAKETLNRWASNVDEQTWNLFMRNILLKDLRCGVSETTINKVLKKIKGKALYYIVPTFECNLAHDSKKHPQHMTGIKMLDEKHDGVRLLTIVRKSGVVTIHTRNGKLNENFPSVQKEFEKITKDLQEDFVFDGEIISENFQALMTQVNREKGVDTSDSFYQMFDGVSLRRFLEGNDPMSQRGRHLRLSIIFEHHLHNQDVIKLLPKIEVNLDTEEGQEQFQNFFEKCLDKGLEGAMIKDPEAPYECKRTVAWMKYKPTITVDLKIVGYKEGTKQHEGKLGAFQCEGDYEGDFIQVSVGSGYKCSDENDQRKEFWDARDSLIGHIIEVKADVVTTNANGTKSLRFPRFLRFRSIEPGEKI